MNAVVKTDAPPRGDIVEQVIIKGDLAKLTPDERVRYYTEVCRSVGLNPLTKPFEYITLNNKLTLYALRACTDQLRMIHTVSVTSMEESEREGVYIVKTKVQNAEGRTDMAIGAVNINGLKGEALANAMMKTETKSKRRATLSICGLELLDESEVDSIPDAKIGAPPAPPPAPAASQKPPYSREQPVGITQKQAAEMVPTAADKAKAEAIRNDPPHNPETGELGPHIIAVPMSGDQENWIAWGGKIISAFKTAKSPDELAEWATLNNEAMVRCESAGPKAYKSVLGAYQKCSAEFTPKEEPPVPPSPSPPPASVAAEGGSRPQSRVEEFQEWLADQYTSLKACATTAEIEDLRERVLDELSGDEVADRAWRDATAQRAAEVFGSGKRRR